MFIINELREFYVNRENSSKKAIYIAGNVWYYIIIIKQEAMKRTSTKNIRIIRQILSNLTGAEVRRKTIIEAAAAKGLIVNDTWPVIKPGAKGAVHGHYSVIKMIALADSILNKGKMCEPESFISKIRTVTNPVEDVITEQGDESGLFEAAAAFHEEKGCGNNVWGEIPYTEDDVTDELSLMGTYLD